MRLKRETRILGIDDAPFEKGDGPVLVVGTVFRGADFMDGLLSTHVKVDGNDATAKLIKMVNSSRHKEQLQIIMMDGIAMGGFNVVDIVKLNKMTNLAVIVIIRRRPDMNKIADALKHLPDGKKKLLYMAAAGEVREIKHKSGSTFYQAAGIESELAEKLIKSTCKRGLIPEPIRVAHLIARGVTLGESMGRA
jgi:endonuclease V-like protein UPF0215 family